jgi:hypothetical protein
LLFRGNQMVLQRTLFDEGKLMFDEINFPGGLTVVSLCRKPTITDMKTKNFLLIGLLVFLLPGCFVKSLHPFFRENEVIFKKELLGSWLGEDSTQWKIEQGRKTTGLFKPDIPGNFYVFTYTDKNGTSRFQVRMFPVAGHLFLDFYPEKVESSSDMMAAHLVPMHTVARVEIAAGRVVLRWYNEEWLIGLFKQNKIRIAHEKIPIEGGKIEGHEYQVVLTASTEELQKFMLKYSDDPKAFSKDYTFVLNKTAGR